METEPKLNSDNLETNLISKSDNINNNSINELCMQYHKYKRYIFIAIVIFLILYLIYKNDVNIISVPNLNFTKNLKKNKKSKQNSDDDSLLLTDSIWNLENEIEKLLKNQNIYLQEKKL